MPSFRDLLAEATDNASSLIDVEESQGEAFRALYDSWVHQGGHERGKPRRSVRQMRIWLGTDREVRSLETKLAGKTLLQLTDVRNLVGLFLERWRYDASAGTDLAYPHNDLARIADELAAEICPVDSNGRSIGLRLPKRVRRSIPEATPIRQRPERKSHNLIQSDAPDDTQDSEEAIARLYLDSNALITVSRERTFIGKDPSSIMIGFQSLMDKLRRIDEADDRFRSLIWIADVGSREGDARAQTALHNLDFLATQFRSLLLTDHPERKARSQWFKAHAAVLVGALQQSEIDSIYNEAGLALASPNRKGDWITADRLFLDGVPDSWIERIVIEGPEAIRQRTITVHRDLDQSRPSQPVGANWNDLRFLMHAPLRGANGEIAPRCVELPGLDRRWSDTFRMAHEVALLRLDQRVNPTLQNTPEQGLTLLRNHGFAALTATELCRLTNLLAF